MRISGNINMAQMTTESVNSKTANALKNKARKQQEALERLQFLRTSGNPRLVAEAIWRGNQYTRAVAFNKHLAPGISEFKLTDDERDALNTINDAAAYYEKAVGEKVPQNLTALELMNRVVIRRDLDDQLRSLWEGFRKRLVESIMLD